MDVLTWQVSWDTLVHRGVSSDDDMHDYSISQAYRGIAHKFDADPAPFTASPQQEPNTAAHNILQAMSLSVVQSASQRATAVFILVRLLLEEGSCHGESNRVPELASRMPSWIAHHAARCLSRNGSCEVIAGLVDRRHSMGFAVLLREGVLCLAETLKRQSNFMCSVRPEFVKTVLRDVCPLLSSLGEGLDDGFHLGGPVPSSSEGRRPPPTRRTFECNTSLVILIVAMLEDIVSADTRSAADEDKQRGTNPKARLVVVDTSLGPLVWDAERMVTRALRRHEQWLRDSAESLKQSFRASLDSDETSAPLNEQPDEEVAASLLFNTTERWALADLMKLWESDVSSPLRQEYQSLEVAHLSTTRTFGGGATDAQRLQSAQWGLTMRMGVLVISIARGVVMLNSGGLHASSSVGGGGLSGASEAHHYHGAIVRSLVEEVVRHVPQLEGVETPQQALVGRMAMLSVASTLFFVFPMEVQQEQLWSSTASVAGGGSGGTTNITEALHQALLMRPLRYRDPVVVRLATYVSSSILHSIAGHARYNAMDIGGEDLLELMRSGRDDGASRGAVQMVAMACMTRPHVMIPSLFRLLQDREHKAARDNALDVLDCIPGLLAASMAVSSQDNTILVDDGEAAKSSLLRNRARRVRQSQEDRFREAIRLLGDHLLISLGDDEELQHRQHAAALFSIFDPSDVVRPLVLMLLKRDTCGKRRDAATKALAAVLSSGGLIHRLDVAPPPTTTTRGGKSDTKLQNTTTTQLLGTTKRFDCSPKLNGIVELLRTCRDLLVANVAESLQRSQPCRPDDTPADGAHEKMLQQLQQQQRVPGTPGDILVLSQLHQLAADEQDVGTVPHDDSSAGESSSTPDSPSAISHAEVAKRLLSVMTTSVQSWASHLCSEQERSTCADLLVQFLHCCLSLGGDGDVASPLSTSSSALDEQLWESLRQLAIRAASTAIATSFKSCAPAPDGKSFEAERQHHAALAITTFLMNHISVLGVPTDVTESVDEHMFIFRVLFALVAIKAIPTTVLRREDPNPTTAGAGGGAASEWANVVGQLVHLLLHSMSRSIRDHGVSDAVRKVLLEALCKFPLKIVLPCISQSGAAELVSACHRATTTAATLHHHTERDLSVGLHHETHAPPFDASVASISYRAYLFILQHEVVTATQLLFRTSSGGISDGLWTFLLEEFKQRLLPFVSAVLRWHITSLQKDGKTSVVVDEASHVKLWMSSIDALAILFVISLRAEGPVTGQEPRVWDVVAEGILNPLRAAILDPSNAHRVLVNDDETLRDICHCEDEDAQQVAVTPLLSIVWFDVLQASVKIVVQQEGTVARGWVRAWGRTVLPLLVRCANAVARAASASASSQEKTSLVSALRRCISPILSLVVIRPAANLPSVASTLPEGDDAVSTMDLDPEDETALIDFALGCLVYESQPIVQFEGIKLAAACIGRLPQRVLMEAAAESSGGRFAAAHPTSSGQPLPLSGCGLAVAGGHTRMDVLFSRLTTMALMHPIGEARQLAEKVVALLSPS